MRRKTYTVTQALKAIPDHILHSHSRFRHVRPQRDLRQPVSKRIAWERETSVEYFDPEQSYIQFQLDAGIRIQGGVDRDPAGLKRKSFRLFFRNEYGAGKLNFPIFGSDYPVSSFDTLILKGGHNYNWANAGGTPVSRVIISATSSPAIPRPIWTAFPPRNLRPALHQWPLLGRVRSHRRTR